MRNETFWIRSMKIQRQQKNEFFKEHEQSPIMDYNRNQFSGLDYFEPNSKYRFELVFKKSPDHNTIMINDSKGNVRDFLIWGAFHFEIDSATYILQAYKSNKDEKRLFLPFKDLTNGKETYGAGRYLDLYSDEDLLDDGKWILDFNTATNPWCAYSEEYACPLVPPANWLKVEIKAGEKTYPLSDH